MPELNIAPSPSPVVAAVDSAAAANAPPTGGTSASSPDDQTTTSFATVLRDHLAQPDDSKAAKVIEALLGVQGAADVPAASTSATTADPAANPPADAIAFLAQMLAGIVPAQAAVVSTSPKQEAGVSATQEDKDAATSAIANAAPYLPIASNIAPPSVPASAQPARTLPVTETLSPPSAILAAAKPAATGSAAETGNTGSAPQIGFESLLNAAHEAPAAVAAHNAVAANAAPPLSTPAVATVTTPVGVRGWDSEIGEKLTWMIGRQETRAELVLNPPQLGRIEVSLSMNGDQANAVFVSANPAVREALENALPHLREILQGAGISLGQTQVGAESFQQQANNRENGDNPSGGNDRDADAMANGLIAGSSTPSQWLRRGNGLVDTFA